MGDLPRAEEELELPARLVRAVRVQVHDDAGVARDGLCDTVVLAEDVDQAVDQRGLGYSYVHQHRVPEFIIGRVPLDPTAVRPEFFGRLLFAAPFRLDVPECLAVFSSFG